MTSAVKGGVVVGILATGFAWSMFVSPAVCEAAFQGVNGTIAFVSVRDGNHEIYVMNADGSEQTNLTNNAAEDDDPAWSPDGSKIAFHSNRSGHVDVYVMNADGSGVTPLTTDAGANASPRWSADGSRLTFASSRDGNVEIYVMNVDGSGVNRLTDNAASDVNPRWSPDGSKIAFLSDRANNGNWDIYVMNADGTNVTQLTFNSRDNYEPDWSVDGAKLLFWSGSSNSGDVYVMNADGSGISKLSEDSADDTAPAWSPDGTAIVFSSNRGGNYGICVMSADGSGATCLTNGGDINPDWAKVPAGQPARPLITWTNPADIVYGTLLGPAQLDATADVPGTFTYSPAAGMLLRTGASQTLSATFTPADAAAYTTATTTVRINVVQATPVVTWTKPAGIVYGAPLGSSQLNATADVLGTFIYMPPFGTILPLGAAQTLSVVFTPADGAEYSNATASVTIDVVSGTPVPLGMFTGRVTDAATLLSLAGIDAWVYEGNGSFVATTRTGADGVYATPLLSPATYHVRTFNNQEYLDEWYDSVACLANCGAGEGRAVTVVAGSTVAGIDFILEKGGSVAGLVTDAATGAPVANLSVDILDEAGNFISSSWTRTDGTYTSTGLPAGSYRARTSNPLGYQEKLYENVTCVGGNCDPSMGAPIVVTDVTQTGGIDFVLDRGGRVAGAVRDAAAGGPLANVTIQVFTSTGTFAASAPTNGAGNYQTSGLPAGTYRARTLNNLGYKDVLFSAADCAPICDVTSGTPIEVTVGTTISSVDFGLTVGGEVAGRVVAAATGAPLANVSIQVSGSAGSFMTSTSTNGAGLYSLGGLPTGTYFVRTGNSLGYQDKVYNDLFCAGSGCSALSGTPIVVTEGATRVGIDFVLENRPSTELSVAPVSGAHSGTINLSATLTSTGLPVAGRTVSFMVNGSSGGTATTNADGVATIAGMGLAINARLYTGGVQASFAGDISYQSSSGAADLAVMKLVPTVTWSMPPAIVYGTPLGLGQLNATANVPGTWVYKPPAGTVLPVGDAQGLSVTFVPTDAVNYSTVVAGVTIEVESTAPPPQPTFQVLHSFGGTDGAYPLASLFQSRAGDFYATTSLGGPTGIGTVYRMDAAGTVTTQHAFGWGDGAFPVAGLIEGRDGYFYGTTSFGTVYQTDATGTVSRLHTFTGADGAYPAAGLIPGSDGYFYGTTTNGGPGGVGTVYRMDAAGSLTMLHAFTGAGGAYPNAGVIQGSDGNFYGTTTYGGASGAGTVYRMDAAGTVTVLHEFARTDGAYPWAGLLQGSDGYFYGTTGTGGPGWAGTVYRMDAAGTMTTLHAFTGADGADPRAGLIQGSDGFFYGTTSHGGRSGAGTVFRMDAAGHLTMLHAFTGGADGAYLYASPIQAQDGFLYGTAHSGGTHGVGTVFRVTLAAGSTTSDLLVPPASGVYGGTIRVSATLTASNAPLAGEPVSFAFNGVPVVTAITDAAGVATVTGVSLAGVRAGANTIEATFAGDAFHAVAQGTADLIVAPAIPTVVWPLPADIRSGTSLGSAQLNAVADVPGTFTYSPSEGTVLRPGAAQVLSVVFTPADAIDYSVVVATTSIDVLKAVPRIVWDNPTDIAFGTALGSAQLNASADVPGTFAYTPDPGTILPVGSGQTLTAIFTPADAANYTSQMASASINVVVPEEITGTEQLGWDQTAADAVNLGTNRYALYVDGARFELTDVSCTTSSTAGAFLCHARLPSIPPGTHTLELGTFTVPGATVRESSRSAPLIVVVAPTNPPPGNDR